MGIHMNSIKRNGKTTSFQKKDIYTIIVQVAIMAILAFRIPFGYLAGENGNAYFSAANEIYFVIAGTVSFGLSEAVSALVRYRVRREQYKSAQKVLKGALMAGGLVGLLLALLFGLLGNVFATEVLNSPLSGLAIRLMAPSMFFVILTGIFKGYFKGNGSNIPSMHSLILNVLFYIVGGLVGTSILRAYGDKVSALLQNENYACSYGAMGASIGLLTASIFCFVHMLVLYYMYSSRMKRQAGRENVKNQDSRMQIFHMLAGTGMQYFAFWFVFSCLPLIQQLFLYQLNPNLEGITGQWGSYYGKYLVIIGIICLIINLIWVVPIRRIITLQEREEFRLARERMSILMHQCAVITIPAAIFLAVFSENILDILWNGNNQNTAVWLQLGSIIIILFEFGAIFMELVRRNKSMKLIAVIGAGALALHIILTIILLMNTKLGISALIIGNIVFFAVLAGVGFFLVSRMLQYRQEWLHSFAITIIAAAVSGVIAMLLNKVFAPMLGSIITFVICLPIACIAYIVILIVARGFNEDELDNMAGGRLLRIVSGWFRFL